MPHSEVLIKADRFGTITAYSGHTEIGQGADTVLAYIVAEVLGTSADDIALVLRDSDATPPDLGSYSSRVTMMMGNAAKQAAEKLRDALARGAAEFLEMNVEDVRFSDRRVGIPEDTERSVTIEEAIEKAEAQVGALSFSGSFKPNPEYGDFKGAGVGPSPAYSFAACVVHVAVDPITGVPAPKKVWIAHDIGRCISRKNVEGQIEGGIYMGLGEAQMEEMAYTRDGLLKNVSILDYKMPTIMETPELEMYIVESPDEKGPFGAKEAGQGPLLPVIPAFVNAVHDAIGIRFDEIPVTPDKVLRALNRGDDRVGPRKIVDYEFPEPVRAEVPADASA
jgi:4-hydroxybenzoyl-CoA reductase subunit alpha